MTKVCLMRKCSVVVVVEGKNITRVCLMRRCHVVVVVEGPEYDQGLSDEDMPCCCCC